MIESVNNEKIKKYVKLQLKKYRDREGMFIVEGEHLVEEARNTGVLVEAFSLDGSVGTQVSLAVMKKLTSLKSVPNVLGIARKREESLKLGNILILDNLQDPGNLGTIIRSAAAFGIDTIIASNNTVDFYNLKTIRSSEGMLFYVNLLKGDIEEFILNNKDKYTIYNTNVVGGIDVSDIEVNTPFALIMGNEGAGVSARIQKLAHKNVYIPMNSKCESLNVAMATSIILYEFSKRG